MTSPSSESVQSELKAVLSDGDDAVASLTAEKLVTADLAGSEVAGILRKSS